MAATPKTLQNLIFCTGFDIFVGHERQNASWEAVKLLPSTIKHGSMEYVIEKVKLPVSYEHVDEVIPKIWERNPKVIKEDKIFLLFTYFISSSTTVSDTLRCLCKSYKYYFGSVCL